MRDDELQQIEQDLLKGFEELGINGVTLKEYVESSNTDDIYGEEDDTYDREIDLIAVANHSPKKEELTDIGVERDAEIIFVVPSMELRQHSLLDEYNRVSIDMESVIEFQGEEYNIVNIVPKSQVSNIYLEYHFECIKK